MKKPPMRTEPHQGLFRGDIFNGISTKRICQRFSKIITCTGSNFVQPPEPYQTNGVKSSVFSLVRSVLTPRTLFLKSLLIISCIGREKMTICN